METKKKGEEQQKKRRREKNEVMTESVLAMHQILAPLRLDVVRLALRRRLPECWPAARRGHSEGGCEIRWPWRRGRFGSSRTFPPALQNVVRERACCSLA